MYRFGDLEIDVPGRELRRHGESIHLEPQAFDLLGYLIEHRDRVVGKIELLDGVWGHRFLSEANLTTRVKEVRRAVGDDGTRQYAIKNVRGRGYRFVAPVEVITRPNPPTGSSGTGLIGRDAELRELLDLLVGSELVTLIGPGGVGKSTLAGVAASVVGDSYEAGVYHVDLGALAIGEHVLPAVALVLDVVLERDRPEDAIRSVAGLDALLVLDNCEHVVDEVISIVDQVLKIDGARVRILATSQVRLGVSIESVVAVRPLTVEAASEMFEARARAVLASWDAQAISRDRVDRLVSGLDRLPLTIEMAAARVGSMTFDDLERTIDQGMQLLQMSHRSPVRRHRSLESLVTWSAELLDSELRRVFTEFSVFSGGVTAADAGAILTPDAPSSLIVGLASLAERSLLVADLDRSHTRYAMLTTVRAVAGRWLDQDGMADSVQRRHAEHITDVVSLIDDQFRTPQEVDARQRLDGLVNEVRVAHRWARGRCPGLAARLSGALFNGAYRSVWNEPAEWSRALLERATDSDRAQLLGAVVMTAGAAAHRGDLTFAREQANAVAAVSVGRLRAIAVEVLADVALYEGDLAGATRAGIELRRLGAELGDLHASTFGTVDVALALCFGGDPSGALDELERADLGELAPTDLAWLAYTRGAALSALGEPDAADEFLEAIAFGETVGNRFVISVARMNLAIEHARAGDFAAALDASADALRDYLRHGNSIHAVTAMRNLVGMFEALGDDRGATLLGGAMSRRDLRASFGAEADQISEVLERVERRVGVGCFTDWFEQGRALAVDAALRAAVELVDQHRT